MFDENGARNRHQEEHHRRYKCDWCDKMYVRKEALQDHIKVVHTKDEGRRCPFCGKMLRGKNPYYYHIKKCSKKEKK
jgi:uncharacterized C2H2 Zn-finger protein